LSSAPLKLVHIYKRSWSGVAMDYSMKLYITYMDGLWWYIVAIAPLTYLYIIHNLASIIYMEK